MMALSLNLLALLLALVVVPACLYLGTFTLLSVQSPRPAASSRRTRFIVLVPAHNERSLIARAVINLRSLDWPASAFRVVVIADNCSDDTAELARAAGASVLERQNPEERGKGYALAYAFGQLEQQAWADAFVVIDADTLVSPGLLDAFASRIESGALAVQAHYDVLNRDAAWRTRMLAVAYGCFHKVRSRARERLGLSCGIRGNGWCITTAALQRVPYGAFTLTEDAEFGIDLGLAGIRVHYADEVDVAADAATSRQVSESQRQRWEHGRLHLIRTRLLRLLGLAVAQRSRVALDLALDLLIWPLSTIAALLILLLLIGSIGGQWYPTLLWGRDLGVFCLLLLVMHVLRGWQLSGTGARGLLDLARAPGFIAWKLLLMLRRHDGGAWVRTTREEP